MSGQEEVEEILDRIKRLKVLLETAPPNNSPDVARITLQFTAVMTEQYIELGKKVNGLTARVKKLEDQTGRSERLDEC